MPSHFSYYIVDIIIWAYSDFTSIVLSSTIIWNCRKI